MFLGWVHIFYLSNKCFLMLCISLQKRIKCKKKGGQVDVSLLYSRLQVGFCTMVSIKFEFNVVYEKRF